ncbi:alpha-L-arabinofuranosidase C-terminal domain-containing protein [uncultured Bacteroides sp.]|uniref:alpha-L-arabinofuranosidase C-terminal domain-containing protein n=1 Tax=uncultured Bacteroides sp. TaxID=162156 RepID=UPI0026046622|nr:alpha-L-arabinofuranosidase C-terminal domain-containing protein [uncultured Bacteroides sp.]
MKKIAYFFATCLLLACGTTLQARIAKVTNEPDSVFLFSYSDAGGQSGLRFAWSPEGTQWFSVADGYDYVKCDFGPWGRQKKMFRPKLVQDRTDGRWHCLWTATQSGEVLAHAASIDLLKWGPQSYFTEIDRVKYCPSNTVSVTEKKTIVKGREENGWMQRVSYATVEELIRFAEHRKYRQILYDERTEQDPARFANLKPLEATIHVETSQAKPMSEHLIGVFFEDINYAADGGLYAELIQNRDFEYSSKDGSRQGWDSSYAWLVKGDHATFTIATTNPIHENNPHYAILNVNQPGASLQNDGFDGIALKKGEKYDFSLFARVPQNSKGGKILVKLLDQDGREIASSSVSVSSKGWRKQSTVLTANADVRAAVLALIPQAAGTYELDLISLFPRNTFRGHKNGLRADLAQTLADMKPRFVRFPGGCVAHGDGVDNIYDWKGSIGPLETRKPLRNLWGYHQTRGLGYFEYFQYCEDIGAEPVPVLAAGVPCQNSGSCSHHSKGELGCNGQQGGIPMEEMGTYIQDILDLIEYANGDAKKTVWGRKRAEAGHPKPFDLKFIGIGNEDLITDVFVERFTMIFKAIKAKHPEITVIGTVGPFYEGTDYDEGWALASKLNIPMVDEHYYVTPGWLIHNQDYYDRYDRNKSKVYLGEYAAHLPGRPNNVETALAEALYLTSIERNADVVSMTSYAPLLAKENHTQWNPDLIYFNNVEVKPTVGYYTQQMYGQNAGTDYLKSTVSLNDSQDAVKKRVGVSVVKDSHSGDYIVKLVNLLPVEVASQVRLEGASLVNPTATKTLLTGDPKDKMAKSVSSDFEVKGTDFPYTMPAYSFTVIRIHSTNK